jgi:hypothetical protein
MTRYLLNQEKKEAAVRRSCDDNVERFWSRRSIAVVVVVVVIVFVADLEKGGRKHHEGRTVKEVTHKEGSDAK